jgi:hypothetical protein
MGIAINNDILLKEVIKEEQTTVFCFLKASDD